MLERNQERLYFDLGEGRIKAEIYRLPRRGAYVCKITFPGGNVVSSVAERMSWTSVDGAKTWAKMRAQEWAEVSGE